MFHKRVIIGKKQCHQYDSKKSRKSLYFEKQPQKRTEGLITNMLTQYAPRFNEERIVYMKFKST